MNKIILFYKYTKISDPKCLQERELAVAKVLDLKGRILIAPEGINGTLEGTVENIEKYKAHILNDTKFRKMNIKESLGTENQTAFPKLSVKVKKEIVSVGMLSINPNRETGKYLEAKDLKKWYENNEDFVVVDMRNDYELASGYFKKTINQEINFNLKASRDLPMAVQNSKLKIYQDKKIVTVCTGGVRCEKMSAYLLSQGFKNVYQLHNGMHTYMEKYPGEDFQGTLFTFDNRLTMDFGGENREIVGKCLNCQNKSENYVNCSNNARVNVGDKTKKLCNKKIIVCGDCVEKLNKHQENILCEDCQKI